MSVNDSRAAGGYPSPPGRTPSPKSDAAVRRSNTSVRRAVAEYTEHVQAAAAAGERVLCWLCNQPISFDVLDPYADDRFEVDHVWPVSTHPEYADDPNNLRPSHRGCNRERGADMEAVHLGWTSIDWEALGDDQQPARPSTRRRHEGEQWSTTEELDPADVARQRLLDDGW